MLIDRSMRKPKKNGDSNKVNSAISIFLIPMVPVKSTFIKKKSLFN